MQWGDNLEYDAEKHIRPEISQNLQPFAFTCMECIMLSAMMAL